jgi:nitric-oxide synthase
MRLDQDHQGPILPDPRWRISRNGQPDDGARGTNDINGARGQKTGEGTAIVPFQACPVAEDLAEDIAMPACPVAEDIPVQASPGMAERAERVVVAENTGPGFAGELAVLPDWWAPADYYPFALESLMASAEKFVTMFHTENRAGPPDRRLWNIRREIEATGTYRHTQAELAFGARVAWRNSARCIGRLYWRSLRVRDRRDVSTASDIAAESVAHLREATNGGRIRPVITVFAPDTPWQPGPRILNSQIVRYAGYEIPDSPIVGDPASADVTRLVQDLGWSAGWPPGRFDVLPLIVQEAGALPTLHELPGEAVLEVPIKHPEFRWFADLGLRWYAVPVISDMYLDVGGVRYPAAPFNGWYMCTEIGSRDLGDTGRYDQLPVIAKHMGLATDRDRTLWKDKAMTELNLAVLHSFSTAGVTISDHHTEAARFLQHMEREERQGRLCPADWTWIVPPAASSATPVFHRYYADFDQKPNFYRHPAPRSVTALFPDQAGRDAGAVVPESRYAPPSVADAPALGGPQGRFLE